MAEEQVNGLSLKVYVDTQNNRVIYAECGGDFVDVLFSFLTTPLGAIVSLSPSQSLPLGKGCLNNMYRSVENMDVKNFNTRACKVLLLSPRNSAESHCMNLKLQVDDTLGTKYRCSANCSKISHYSDVLCDCGMPMKDKWKLPLKSMDGAGVFVKDMGFIITDDLQVLCASSSVCFSLFSKLGIMDRRTVEERSFNVGANEIVNMLLQSFVSKTPLSETFLKCKPTPEFIHPILFPERSIDRYSQKVEHQKNEEQRVSLKLMICKSKKTVCYAEADRDFVNLLLSFLTVPLGHLVKNIHNGSFNGCVNHLYKSVQYLDEQCFEDIASAKLVLSPSLALGCWYRNDLVGINKEMGPSSYYYLKSGNDGGFLTGHKMFIVTDSLVITPLSSVLCFSILEEMKVPFTDIEEKIVKVNQELALRLLVSSFVSESALTDTFMREAKPIC
ncbi:hypothetical protein UlMin_013298 [Ulmus minor]